MTCGRIFLYVIAISSFGKTLATQSRLNQFFGGGIMSSDDLNLTAITWAHAVNSQKELDNALQSDVNMIEADIMLGQINGSELIVPLMGHPPAEKFDITLKDFLYRILDHNRNASIQKGVKLDFKSIEVFQSSINILLELWPLMTYPVWLNADIIKGPVDEPEAVPVNPERFLTNCNQFKEAVLSLGWTTKWGPNFTKGSYSEEQVDQMIDVIKKYTLTESKQPITFPVRAGIAANSGHQLQKLVQSLNETNEVTLTIWSSVGDYVDIEKLRELILAFGLNRVYLDVPDEISSKLQLNKTQINTAALPTALNCIFISLCVTIAGLALQRALL